MDGSQSTLNEKTVSYQKSGEDPQLPEIQPQPPLRHPERSVVALRTKLQSKASWDGLKKASNNNSDVETSSSEFPRTALPQRMSSKRSKHSSSSRNDGEGQLPTGSAWDESTDDNGTQSDDANRRGDGLKLRNSEAVLEQMMHDTARVSQGARQVPASAFEKDSPELSSSHNVSSEADRPTSDGSLLGLFYPYPISIDSDRTPSQRADSAVTSQKPARVLGAPVKAQPAYNPNARAPVSAASVRTMPLRDFYQAMRRSGVQEDQAWKTLEGLGDKDEMQPSRNAKQPPAAPERSILKRSPLGRVYSVGDIKAKQATTKRRSLSSPPSRATSEPPPLPPAPNTPAPSRKVSLAPLPLSLHDRDPSAPEIVRTPYPFLKLDPSKSPHLDSRRSTPTSRPFEEKQRDSTLYGALGADAPDVVLTLTVRRQHAPYGRRIARLTIPADRSAAPSPVAKLNPLTENRTSFTSPIRASSPGRRKSGALLVPPPAFDDTALFACLRDRYNHSLLGESILWRFFRRRLAARTLKRIVVTELDSDEARPRSGPGDGLRSPRFSARRGLSDTFSEAELFALFKRPSMARGYGWVHWARRLCKNVETHEHHFSSDELEPCPSTASAPLPPGGLEFMEGWSARRIISAVGTVLFLSVAVVLVYVLIGPRPIPAGPTASAGADGDGGRHSAATLAQDGFDDAEGRVVPGVLLGGLVAVLGGAGVGGWIFVSWVCMR